MHLLERLRLIGDLGQMQRHQARPTTTARPRNEKKPITSVAVVTNTADDTAGSIFSRSSVTGTAIPARPAVRLLITIAAAITPPSSGLWNRTATASPISTPRHRPLTAAMRNSRPIMRQVFELVSWLVAS